MLSKRALFRRELLQALIRFASADGVQLLTQLKANGRIVDVYYYGEKPQDFYNLRVDFADFQPDVPSTDVRLSVSITDTRMTEVGTLLIGQNGSWVEDQLVSLGQD